MKHFLLVFLVTVFLTVPSAAAFEEVWGDITGNLRVGLFAEKTELQIQEAGTFRFVVKNDGKEPILVPIPDQGTLAFFEGEEHLALATTSGCPSIALRRH